MAEVRNRIGAAALLATLVGCGGGGGGGTLPPTANSPPVFTSAASASVAENASGAVYTATATDANGNAITYSLAGGPDAARFALSGAGVLTFTAPPDFEAPADADGNNSYVVQIAASDGAATTTIEVIVSVANSGPDSFIVRRVGTGFNQPVFVAPVPGDADRLLVVERIGRIRSLTIANGVIAPTPFLDITSTVSSEGERGLLGLALAPDFGTSGTFYVYLTLLNGDIELRRYRTQTGNRDAADPASADILLRISHPRTNHNGGWIDFGADGFLYVGVGDGGGNGDPDDNGQNRNTLLGKILRLDVAGDAFPADPNRDYAIPVDNPFAAGGGAPEVWALGLRNPYRSSFDRATGNLFIADVGQNMVEEVNLMRPSDKGANFGWPIREGTQPFRSSTSDTLVNPVLQYFHGAGPRQGRSVTGGYVYRGPVEALVGRYFFADFITANIWSVPVSRLSVGSTLSSDEFTVRNSEFQPNAGAINNPASFGLDAAGNLYIVDFDGEIFRVEPT